MTYVVAVISETLGGTSNRYPTCANQPIKNVFVPHKHMEIAFYSEIVFM